MAHISNPKGAFGYRPDETPVGQVIAEHVAGAAVGAGQAVSIAYTPATGAITVVPTTATTSAAIGVAVDPAESGQTVKVVTHGPALVRATASQTAGSSGTNTAVSGSANGRIVAAPATLGHRILGFVLQDMTGAANDALVGIYVNPHTAYAS